MPPLRLAGSTILFLALSCLLTVSNLRPATGQDFEFQPATTVQLPVFGVAVSPEGVLKHVQYAPPGGQLFFQRARAAVARMDQDLLRKSPLRKISLKRLQQEIDNHLTAGTPLPDDILKLAGLQRVQYLFAFPDQDDIVIAGPAEGWVQNAGGRAVGITTGRPVVLLEDLAVALRVFTQDQPKDIWVGCSIGTTAEGRRRLNELQRKIPDRISTRDEQRLAQAIVPAIEEALGNAGVTVFGVAPETNMARVMLEADYRMKLIAIGREPPPISMPTFFEKLKGAPRGNFQRWWFTPNYQCVEISPDHLSLHMAGQGVQLGTEEYRQDGQGRLVQLKTRPLRAARLYAEAFTEKYEEIAVASPVFGQLRNMIDLLITANFIQREHLFAKVGLDQSLLLDNRAIPVDTRTTPVAAKAMANARWESNHLIAPSGGVCILASEAFKEEYRLDLDADHLAEVNAASRPDANHTHWWWD